MKPGLTPYDVLSQIKQWTQQVGTNQPTIQNFEYDYEGQVVNDVVTPQGQPAVKAYTYGYDAAGNRTSEEVDVSPVATVTRSSYNGVNQLTSRTGSGTLPVRFQGTINKPGTVSVNSQAASISTNPANAGGRIFTTTNLLLIAGNQTSSITAYDLNHNMAVTNYTLTVVGGTNKTFAYDNNGNCTNMSTAGTNTVYQWDAENRLVVISIYVANSGTTNRSEFTYDGFGRRVQAVEKNNGTVTSTKRFVWAGLELAQERAANNAVTKRFFGGGEQIGGTNCYFTRDHLGSVREMTDSSGTVRARYDYDPYGRQTKLVGDLDADFGFTGHYVHAPSGLYLTLFRAYNADSGRWLNRDPLGEAGGMNLYGYVGNNPIRHFDPLGLAMGDWWDARTWFNSGFTESWSDSANSIGQSMGGALAGNMNQVAGGYEKGVLGQTECGPTWAKWGTRGALGIGVVATAGIAVAALPAPGAVLYYDLIGNPITVGEFASAVVTTPIAVAAPYVSSAVQATALFYIQNQEFVPVTIALTEDVIGIEDPTPPAGGDFVGGLYYIISQSFQTISKSLNE